MGSEVPAAPESVPLRRRGGVQVWGRVRSVVCFPPTCLTECVELVACTWVTRASAALLVLFTDRCSGLSSFGASEGLNPRNVSVTPPHLSPYFISHQAPVIVPPRDLLGPLFSLPVTVPYSEPWFPAGKGHSSAPSRRWQWVLPAYPNIQKVSFPGLPTPAIPPLRLPCCSLSCPAL